ncbi:MAG: CvpA family protein [Holosporales bacterium]|jgi:membrane protein required for colicin V production|nr:CvpA family protein [Holosporales bacterium]
MDSAEFLTFDIIILVVVLLSFIIGWVRGMTREALAIVTWIGGIYLTVAIFPHAQGVARSHIKQGLIADFATVCALFIAFLTLLSIVNYYCSSFIKKSMLSMVDKVLGGMFGIVRGIVILAAADIVISQLFTEPPEIIERSKLRPAISGIANIMLLMLPDTVQSKLISHMSQLRKQNFLAFINENVIENIATDAVNNLLEERVIASGEAKTTEEQPQQDNVVEAPSSQPADNQTARGLASLKPAPPKPSQPPGATTDNERKAMSRILDQYKTFEPESQTSPPAP